VRILVNPDQLRALSARLQQTAGDLRAVEGRVGSALGGLNWEARQKVGVDAQVVAQAREQARTLASGAEEMAHYLVTKAQAFEEADRQGVRGLEIVIDKYPIPTPIPVPSQEDNQGIGVSDSVKDGIGLLDDLLKPIDWISDHKKATKAFRETLERLGRILNSLTGKRGHIKLLGELADVLTGTAKAVSATSDLLALKDFQSYFAGKVSNQEIARTAIEALIPIPFLDDKIADWFAGNVPNPNGRWHGLVGKVE